MQIYKIMSEVRLQYIAPGIHKKITVPEKSKGLGDTVEKIMKATGIKWVVDKISEVTGKDCGCNARKNKLNKMLTYGK